MSIKHLIILATLAYATPAVAEGEEPGTRKQLGGSMRTADSTNIDFNETMIDGKMQAPSGFFLQGRQAQSMSQMVKLRNKWRSELRNSKSAVKAIVK